MQSIISGIQSILNFFETIWDFIVKFIEDIIYVIKTLGQILINIRGYFNWLPSVVYSLLFVGLSVVVIYKVINRD